jgi:hypothetical protein
LASGRRLSSTRSLLRHGARLEIRSDDERRRIEWSSRSGYDLAATIDAIRMLFEAQVQSSASVAASRQRDVGALAIGG